MCICNDTTALSFLEQCYLIFWPEEASYSEVPPSKIVEPKKPAVGDKVKVKAGRKVHMGEVAGFGTKAEMEKLMLDLEGQDDSSDEETAVEGEQARRTDQVETEQKPKQGKKVIDSYAWCIVHVHVHVQRY